MTDTIEKSWPIEEIVKLPLPGFSIPIQIHFSTDDSIISYLYSEKGNLSRSLFAFDPETGTRQLLIKPAENTPGEGDLSIEETLRRERQRQRGLGISSYAWASKANRLLVPIGSDLYVQDDPEAPQRCLVSGGDRPILDPQIAPNGEWIAYVQDSELYVVPFEGGEPRQITDGAREIGLQHGLAEYVAQEEMERSHGYWWSPDSQSIAFTEVDERPIPLYRIVHQGKDVVGEVAQEEHHYPFAGGNNALVRIGVVAVTGGVVNWLDFVAGNDSYLARVHWWVDGRLSAQVINREQNVLEIRLFDINTGRSQLLLREENTIWINLHHMLRPLEDGRFIWASERSGFRHLYLYDAGGALIRQLTAGDWVVDEIVAVDEERDLVYFLGNRESPIERHLYVVSFDGGAPRRITVERGWHSVVVDHGCRRFVDTYQSKDQPPFIRLCSLKHGSPITMVYDKNDSRIQALDLRPPEYVTLQSRDGVTLYGLVFRPPARFGDGPFPTILSVYGGPHSQKVTDNWESTVRMQNQYWSRQGFLVFVLDNRGTSRRGLAFEGAIKNDLGTLEVHDQIDGIHWLIGQGLTDPERVGVTGWSYGGYMALMCLAKAPELFKVAVAGAPVTHWDGYDTFYTERYMGTPDSNPEGYRRSSVMNYVSQISGHLLIVHGLIDENVHFRHSARLINALIEARVNYDLLLFPDERHGPRREADRIYLEQRNIDYFLRYLK